MPQQQALTTVTKSGGVLVISLLRVLMLTGVTRVELAAVRMLRRFAFTLSFLLIGALGLAFMALAAFLGLQAAYGGPLAALIVGLGCLLLATGGMLSMLLNNRMRS